MDRKANEQILPQVCKQALSPMNHNRSAVWEQSAIQLLKKTMVQRSPRYATICHQEDEQENLIKQNVDLQNVDLQNVDLQVDDVITMLDSTELT